MSNMWWALSFSNGSRIYEDDIQEYIVFRRRYPITDNRNVFSQRYHDDLTVYSIIRDYSPYSSRLLDTAPLPPPPHQRFESFDVFSGPLDGGEGRSFSHRFYAGLGVDVSTTFGADVVSTKLNNNNTIRAVSQTAV